MSEMSREEFVKRARELRWLLTDVDGVLTDGGLHYPETGAPVKIFNAKDGLGLQLAQLAGLKVGLLSAKKTAAVQRRADDLGLDIAILGRSDKGPALDEFLADQGIAAHQLAYIGDDLPDLPVLERCGVGFAPADAAKEVLETAHVRLEAPGGRGAAREAVERLLEARGQWKEVVQAWRTQS